MTVYCERFIRKPEIKLASALFALLAVLLFTGNKAEAHMNTIGYSNITVEGSSVAYELYLDPQEINQWVDYQSDGVFIIDPGAKPRKEGEAGWAKADMDRLIADHLAVSSGQQTVQGKIGEVLIQEKENKPSARILIDYNFAQPVEKLDIQYDFFFEDLDPQHQNFSTIHTANGDIETVFHQNHRTVTYTLEEGADAGTVTTEVKLPRWAVTLFDYVWLGMEHIWSGYDHLLFVLALILLKQRLRNYFVILTAFTVGHSITIALSALEVIHLPSSIVEPLIALSIAYVAVENIWFKRMEWRWVIALAFGLIHGFGFAEVLRGALGDGYILPLFSFNLGVEIGQIAVLAVVLPILVYAGRLQWYRSAAYGLSGLITLIGMYWFIERIWF